jgi:uncharacterized surface protein with fasciclin (FAS1) repeats
MKTWIVLALTLPLSAVAKPVLADLHLMMAADLPTTATDVATVNTATVSVVAAPEGATVNGAKITAADIAASNGVIHVIDSVILPPM